jgi:putative endonuclease
LVEKVESTPLLADASAPWFVYILRCADGSLYTGITLDINRRLQEHRGELGLHKGAKSLRGKSPLNLAYSTTLDSRSAALKLEYKIKQLAKAKKEALVNGALSLDQISE